MAFSSLHIFSPEIRLPTGIISRAYPIIEAGIPKRNDWLYHSDRVCPTGTNGCAESKCPNTCYCEDHCSYERCIIEEAPNDCLSQTNAEWTWDPLRRYWVAQWRQGKYNYRIKYYWILFKWQCSYHRGKLYLFYLVNRKVITTWLKRKSHAQKA